MNGTPKLGTPPDGFVDNEPAEEVVNDSLGTVDPADTADTDPKDDPEAGAKSGRSTGRED
jgi:hypothetical protein